MNNKRVDTSAKYISLGIAFIFISLFYLAIYFKKSKIEYISYEDKTIVDYNVFLKDNDFYNTNYQGKDKEYVADLIDYIKANFKYNLNFNKELDYNYSYKLVANVDIYNRDSNNSLYNYKEELISKNNLQKDSKIKIEEIIEIDYNKYNDIVKEFLNSYKVSNTKSILNIMLILDVNNIKYNNIDIFDIKDKKVANIEIPLDVKTLSLDISNEKDSILNNKILVENNSDRAKVILYISILFFMMFIADFVMFILYFIKTMPYQKIYNRKLRSIYNNFSSNVQRVNGSFSMGPTKPIFVKEFSDILAIGFNLKKPVLSIENKKGDGTLFLVPPENGIAFVYLLSVKSIKNKKEGNNILNNEYDEYLNDYEESNYSKEKIEKTIMETKKVQILDEKEIVEGSSDTNELYDQFNKSLQYKESIASADEDVLTRKINTKHKKINSSKKEEGKANGKTSSKKRISTAKKEKN